MKLFEYEAKELLESYGVKTPGSGDEEYVVKAQVLAKNRKAHGGIEFTSSRTEAERVAEDMKCREVNGHSVENVLIEEKIEFSNEYYVAFLYDTDVRKPVMLFSKDGGSGIEDRQVQKLVIESWQQWRIRDFLKQTGIASAQLTTLARTLHQIGRCLFEADIRMIEVNPLVQSQDEYIAADAVIDLDDNASYRHNWDYDERTPFSREKTEREIRAEQIDEDDHRGVAGKYTELNGDIGMMLAGGGASLANMDALIAYGGKPANYTEYGGNPPTSKVYRLSKVIMDKPGLRGLWHVGGTANNTDVHRTMKGFCQALEETVPDYPIVIRRDGPNADKAFERLRETRDDLGLQMKLFRNDIQMTETAGVLMDMIEYRDRD